MWWAFSIKAVPSGTSRTTPGEEWAGGHRMVGMDCGQEDRPSDFSGLPLKSMGRHEDVSHLAEREKASIGKGSYCSGKHKLGGLH